RALARRPRRRVGPYTTLFRSVLGRVRGAGRTEGGRAGDEPGVDYYEAEVTVDQLAELIFADLGLPNLERKTKPELTQEGYEFRDVRRHGIMSNIDRRRTLREAIKRARLAGRGLRPVIAKEDLRFRTWEEEPRREANAVVMA